MGDIYDTIEMVLKDYVKKDDLRKLADEMRELSNKKNIRSPWTSERLKGIAKGQSDCADRIDKLLDGRSE